MDINTEKLDSAHRFIESIYRISLQWEAGQASDSSSMAEDCISQSAKYLPLNYCMSIQCLVCAVDHFYGALKAYSFPSNVYAACTCTRGCLEASALAIYFSDTSVSPIQRMARQYSWRINGLSQATSTLFALEDRAGDAELVHERIAQITAEAASFGFHFDKALAASPEHRLRKMKITELVKSQLRMEANYRILSAVAHSHNWALIQVGMNISGEGAQSFGNLTVKPEYFSFNLRTLVRSIGLANLTVSHYRDADTRVIVNCLEQATRAGLLVEADQFW
ncbi:MAG: hypothetical protein J0L72_11155 [Armatimonadetes bacterium]|nr:hypothetical protein [Armatimonadota bacterium]